MSTSNVEPGLFIFVEVLLLFDFSLECALLLGLFDGFVVDKFDNLDKHVQDALLREVLL